MGTGNTKKKKMKNETSKKDNEPYRPDTKKHVGYSTVEITQGRTLKTIDFGEQLGVYLELSHPTEQTEPVPILLTPIQAARLAEWLAHSMGQTITRMPLKLLEICRRVAWQKGNEVKLKRGDKAALREVVRILQSREEE